MTFKKSVQLKITAQHTITVDADMAERIKDAGPWYVHIGGDGIIDFSNGQQLLGSFIYSAPIYIERTGGPLNYRRRSLRPYVNRFTAKEIRKR